MKKLKYFSILLLCSLHCLLLSGCSFQKKEEIVWYISNPHFFHIEDAVPYEDLSSERFDLFNKRLEELDIPAKVTFRYLTVSLILIKRVLTFLLILSGL